MKREVDLIKNLPEFMQEYVSLRLIGDAEAEVLQAVLDELHKIDNNQFILTADSDGLKRFEKLLGIAVLPNETLESRRKKVLAKWNDQESYTYSTFLKKLELICGADNYQIVERFKQYELEIHTDLRACDEMAELEHVIDYMLPCNLVLHLSNEMDWSAKGACGMKVIGAFTERFICSDNFKERFSCEGNHGFGGAVSSLFIIDTKERQ